MASIALPEGMVKDSVSLPKKPGARLHFSYVKSSVAGGINLPTVVFLNGLGLPQKFWYPVITKTLASLREDGLDHPNMVTYDRYGQGETVARDPLEVHKEEGYGHDAMDVVHDLKALLDTLAPSPIQSDAPLLLVGNSIGCPVARLFAQEYPGTVWGLLLLDSNIANTDFVSLIPDPDAAEFDESKLPPDITPAILRECRTKVGSMFRPDVRNPEGFDRRNLMKLLPEAGAPKLHGPDGHSPYLVIVGHDPVRFAEEFKSGPLTLPPTVPATYVSPAWNTYNEEMLQISSPDRAIGPIIARNCGHFVQRDSPALVADELSKLIKRFRGIM